MVKTFKVDLDYEASLFDPHYQEDSSASQKIIREFEYVFFLVQKEKSILKNYKSYEPKYLSHLKSLGFVIHDLNPNASPFEYWWGHHQNIDLEQKLNSKLTSAQISKDFHWGFEKGTIVENLEELKAHLALFPKEARWLLKHPHSFSGKGHRYFETQSLDETLLKKILNEKVLLEPVYERVFDIGTTFEIEDGFIKKKFMVENFNSSSGAFKGGAGSSDVDKFKKYIQHKYSYSLDELQTITQKIADIYIQAKAQSNIQIDSFVYKDKETGELKLYALVEVNYRKTMGLVIQAIAEKFSRADWIEWRVEGTKALASNPLSSEWINVSPAGNHFQSYFREVYLP